MWHGWDQGGQEGNLFEEEGELERTHHSVLSARGSSPADRRRVYLHRGCAELSAVLYREKGKYRDLRKLLSSHQFRRMRCRGCRTQGASVACMVCSAVAHPRCALRLGWACTCEGASSGPVREYKSFYCQEHAETARAKQQGARTAKRMIEWLDALDREPSSDEDDES